VYSDDTGTFIGDKQAGLYVIDMLVSMNFLTTLDATEPRKATLQNTLVRVFTDSELTEYLRCYI